MSRVTAPMSASQSRGSLYNLKSVRLLISSHWFSIPEGPLMAGEIRLSLTKGEGRVRVAVLNSAQF